MPFVLNLNHLEFLTSFFAEHLLNLIEKAKKGSFFDFREGSLFDLKEDVPYIANVMAEGFSANKIDGQEMQYWFVQPMTVRPYRAEQMEPILARDIADGAVIYLAISSHLPAPIFPHMNTTTGVSTLYRHCAETFPNESLRPALWSMSENFEAWAGILPFFKKEVSLLVC